MQSYIFGGNSGIDYDTLQKRRKYGQDLAQSQELPSTAAGGLAAIAKAFIGRNARNKADQELSARNDAFQRSLFPEAFASAKSGGQGEGMNAAAANGAAFGQKYGIPQGLSREDLLLSLATNKNFGTDQRNMAMQLYQHELGAEGRALDMQLKRAQLAAANRPAARKIITGADGYQYFQDDGSRVLPNVQAPTQERKIITGADGYQYFQDDGSRVLPDVTKPSHDSRTDDQKEYAEYQTSARAAGNEPLPFLEYLKEVKGASSARTSFSVTNGEDNDAVRKKLSEKEGEAWSGMLDQGVVASGLAADMEILTELVEQAPTGPITGRLTGLFPGFDDAASAFQSVVSRVAPSLRAPGSGSTSDIEYEGFLKALPALRNNPAANRQIIAIINAKSAVDIERANIVALYQNEDVSAREARKRLTELNSRSIMTPELKALLNQAANSEGGASDVDDILNQIEGLQ